MAKQIKPLKWRAILSLVLVYASIFTGWYWLWGVLLLFWVYGDLVSGQCWLSEILDRRNDPILYYLVVMTWVFLGLYLVAEPFFHLLG